jgi:RHS repeat-associated protein
MIRTTFGAHVRDGVTLMLVVLALLALGVTRADAQPEAVEYYATDALGSIRVVFNANGTEVARSDYLPFGEAWAPTGSLPQQRFTGQQRDAEEGLDYFNARSYHVRTGRFEKVDPVGGDPANPQSWNRYSYVLNSPTHATDPSGMLTQGFCSAENSAEMCGGGGPFDSSTSSDGWGRDWVFGDSFAEAVRRGWQPGMPKSFWEALQAYDARIEAQFIAQAIKGPEAKSGGTITNGLEPVEANTIRVKDENSNKYSDLKPTESQTGADWAVVGEYLVKTHDYIHVKVVGTFDRPHAVYASVADAYLDRMLTYLQRDIRGKDVVEAWVYPYHEFLPPGSPQADPRHPTHRK